MLDKIKRMFAFLFGKRNGKKRILFKVENDMPLVWTTTKKGVSNVISVFVHGFFYHPTKKKVFGIINDRQLKKETRSGIPMEELSISSLFEYNHMKYNLSDVVVVGTVYVPQRGIQGIAWNEEKRRLELVKWSALHEMDECRRK